MPEVAAAAKGGASRKMSKQSLAKVTKKPPKKQRKSRQQSNSTHVYRLLTQHIASEDLHLIHYKRHTISAKEIQRAVHLVLPGEQAKHAISKGTKAITKIHQLCLGRSF
ncbi:histone H2B type 1-L-like [Cetorhinus maximus]